MIEQYREQALDLCAAHGVTVRPYAGGWWLFGQQVNRVVGELAGLTMSDLLPMTIVPR
jgi:hypothetical protein